MLKMIMTRANAEWIEFGIEARTGYSNARVESSDSKSDGTDTNMIRELVKQIENNKSYQRPEGFEKEKRDCTVRALSLSSNIAYEDVHAAFKQVGRKDRHGIYAKPIIQTVCKILGIRAVQVKRSGSVRKLVTEYPEGRLFCLKTGHAFSIINGVVHDLQGSGRTHIKGAWLLSTKPEVKHESSN